MGTLIRTLFTGFFLVVIVIPAVLLLMLIALPFLGITLGLAGAVAGILFAILKIGFIIALPIIVIGVILRAIFR